MSQMRFEIHKYARLNSQEELAHNSCSDEYDDGNEEIELDAEHQLHYQANSDPNGKEKRDVVSTPATSQSSTHHYDENGYPNNKNVHHESGLATAALSPTTMNGHHISSSRFMQMAIGSLATILLYLTLSICLTFYQKALIKKLKFPLSIVCYHLIIKLILAAGVRAVYKCLRGKSRVQLEWYTALYRIAPTGVASGIDIGFSNWGLELVSISLYTMTKSTTIVFILFFAILLGLEKKSWSLVFIVGLIASGLFMFTYKSTQFDVLGFIFILVASLSSGIRWSLAQFVMQKSKLGLHNPVDMIFHMQPWMIMSLIPFLVVFEGEKLYGILYDLRNTPNSTVYMIIFKVSFGAVLAFFMEVSEFLVLSRTSSLTLSIAGIFKDICQLALAVELNGDQLSLMNVFGLVVCLAGICCHLVHKYSMLTKFEELDRYGADDISFSENNITTCSTNGIGMKDTNSVSFSTLKKHSAQTMPLLEQSDSDNDSINGTEAHNSSDVIFDILKRRDIQR